jgi:hypothetical protein
MVAGTVAGLLWLKFKKRLSLGQLLVPACLATAAIVFVTPYGAGGPWMQILRAAHGCPPEFDFSWNFVRKSLSCTAEVLGWPFLILSIVFGLYVALDAGVFSQD